MVTKYKLQIVLALMLSVILTSCDPAEIFEDSLYKGHWIIHNTASDTIKISYTSYKNVHFIIPPSSSIDPFYTPEGADIGNRKSAADACFNCFYASATGVEDSIIVYSKSDKELKVWKESDKDSPGKQFFNESSWTKTTYEADGYINYVWTFTILPDDIK
jgi:uncharacterized lipoprotein YehR (DUF1307 family)